MNKWGLNKTWLKVKKDWVAGMDECINKTINLYVGNDCYSKVIRKTCIPINTSIREMVKDQVKNKFENQYRTFKL